MADSLSVPSSARSRPRPRSRRRGVSFRPSGPSDVDRLLDARLSTADAVLVVVDLLPLRRMPARRWSSLSAILLVAAIEELHTTFESVVVAPSSTRCMTVSAESATRPEAVAELTARLRDRLRLVSLHIELTVGVEPLPHDPPRRRDVVEATFGSTKSNSVRAITSWTNHDDPGSSTDSERGRHHEARPRRQASS